ncbi:alpha-crystallin B chain-like [Penaeus monodon]|uniref:alpha-crystallin B chain-like n=1 Tax=Penaeus monodon TaxID=6687 RepID=UPI0018A74FBC|nr:alpha-crystallin B chain-like [Penaeus monodon]
MSRQIPMMYRDPFFRDRDPFLRDIFSDRDIFGERERREHVFDRPSKLFDQVKDQHFGASMAPDDVSVPSSSLYMRSRRPPKERSGVSQLSQDQDKFMMCLDVQQFTPDELKVRVVEGVVEVEGKHEEREDEHGSISRHFLRKYRLPEDVMMDMVGSTLSPDGVLTIEAPKKKLEPPPPSQRDVPIKKSDDKA